MDIEELLKRRQTLEVIIRAEINNIVARFKAETGISISYISVDCLEVTRSGDYKREFCIGSVRCDLAI